jgi:RND family efflux transporter MFP subunit
MSEEPNQELSRRDEQGIARDEPAKELHKPQEGHGHDGPVMDLKPIGTVPALVMIGAFVALLIGLFVVGYLPHRARLARIEEEAAKKTDAKPVVNVVQPKQQKIIPSLSLPGTARAFQSTAVFPRASGYLKRRLVDIGSKVKAGDLLAEIETPEIDAQYLAAQAQLEQAKAAANRAKTDAELAQTTLQRYEGFAATGGVTQQQLDERRSAYETARAAAISADATVKANEAELQRLAALQGFQKVFAPFDGTVTARNFDVGALLSASAGGNPLFQIDETDKLRVAVDVPQSYTEQIKVGAKAEFLVRGIDQPFAGTVARSAGALDPTTRTLRIEADFPNEGGRLLPGMYGQIRYELVRNTLPMTVPSSALVFGPEGTRLMVLDDQSRVRFKPIRVGRDLGVELEIADGLDGKERVVANPGGRLTDGLEVEVAQAPARPQAAASAPPAPRPIEGGTAGDPAANPPAVETRQGNAAR